jgi:hypothetical protein
MELDQLKEMWGDVATVKKVSSDEEIQAILRKKSKSPIAKMKRNLFIEMWVVVILYSVTITDYFLTLKGMMLGLAWLMLASFLLYMLYYVRKRKLLNDMECVSCEVKSNLQQQLRTLEKYIRLYLYLGTLFFPVIMIFTGVILFLYAPELKNQEPTVPLWAFVTALSVIAFVLTIPMYFLNKWYMRKLYGQHVDKLKAIVNEMSAEEN